MERASRRGRFPLSRAGAMMRAVTADKLITLKISNHALKSDTLPTRLKIFGWGANDSTRGTFTAGDKTAKVLSINQHDLGYERVAIDFDHCTVSGTSTHAELLKAGQPPLIFGYGTVKPVAGDGIYLDDITWTPLGLQHARNFEDLSPAIKDEAGEVVLVHSVALTPNGSVHGLQFFSATNNQDKKMTIEELSAQLTDLSKKFDSRLNALEQVKPVDLQPLSARIEDLNKHITASEQAGVDAQRGTLVTLFAKAGKAPKKADGTAYKTEELQALSLDTLQLLHANTPVTVALSARNGTAPETAEKKYRDEKTNLVDMSAIFNDEAVANGQTKPA
ncbi:MAG: hypothetical protein KGL39_44690 [Patescibacteria group bacterium]|nr:hypothetical protein [Patescibacteria group bacterium]